MIVSMWMTRDVVTIEAATPIAEAAALMAAKGIRRLPVVERRPEGARLKGIVSAGDILHAYPPDVNPFAVRADPRQARGIASEIMTPNPITIAPDTPLEEAVSELRDGAIGALPVVHDEMLVGLISESDIFRAFCSLFDHAHGGWRITFDVAKQEDTFAHVGQLARKHQVRVISLLLSTFHNRPIWIVRIVGTGADDFLDALRDPDHRILNVIRMASPDSINTEGLRHSASGTSAVVRSK